MDDKKYKRLEFLHRNINYLSIRERQEYYELLNEFRANELFSSEPDEADFEPHTNQEKNDERMTNSSSDSRYSAPEEEDLSAGNFSSQKPQKQNKKKPKKTKRKLRWIRRLILLLIVIIAAMTGFFIYGYDRGVKHECAVTKAEKFDSTKNSDGTINILLLGADKRPGQASDLAHTDTIMVLHLDPKTKKIRLVSFMRDTLVTIQDVSTSATPDVKINAAFTIGEQYDKQGVNLMSETLQDNFGIKCQYYAVVDFSSFATIIDSLFPNGITIDAKFSTINGQKMNEVPVPDDLAATEGKVSSDRVLTASQAEALGYPDGGGTFMMIKQGVQKMNGRTLLNYARFRHDDEGDAGRVKRQQQVMTTIISKLKNPLTLFTGSSALGTTRAITMTNIPNSFFLTHGLTLLEAMKNGIKSTTIPADNDWQNAYDKYGGLGLLIDMPKYKAEAEKLLGQ